MGVPKRSCTAGSSTYWFPIPLCFSYALDSSPYAAGTDSRLWCYGVFSTEVGYGARVCGTEG
eukprot:2070929-Rhodomonas_salina.1